VALPIVSVLTSLETPFATTVLMTSEVSRGVVTDVLAVTVAAVTELACIVPAMTLPVVLISELPASIPVFAAISIGCANCTLSAVTVITGVAAASANVTDPMLKTLPGVAVHSARVRTLLARR
jgi:hypothetical protein